MEGVDIRKASRDSLRRQYGMVLQDTWLRAGTIKDNIIMGKPDATMEQIIEAAKASHAHSFINKSSFCVLRESCSACRRC